jgi:hypothetical protein
MTPCRIQELESLGFEWKFSIGWWGKGTPRKRSLDDDSTCVRERLMEALAPVQRIAHATAQPQEDFSGREIRSNQVNIAFAPAESDWNGEVHLGYIPGRTEEI